MCNVKRILFIAIKWPGRFIIEQLNELIQMLHNMRPMTKCMSMACVALLCMEVALFVLVCSLIPSKINVSVLPGCILSVIHFAALFSMVSLWIYYTPSFNLRRRKWLRREVKCWKKNGPIQYSFQHAIRAIRFQMVTWGVSEMLMLWVMIFSVALVVSIISIVIVDLFILLVRRLRYDKTKEWKYFKGLFSSQACKILEIGLQLNFFRKLSDEMEEL